MKINRLTEIELEKEYDKVDKDYQTFSDLIEQLYKEGSMVDPETRKFLKRQNDPRFAPDLKGMRKRTVPFDTDEFDDPIEGGKNFGVSPYEIELAEGGDPSRGEARSTFRIFLDAFSGANLQREKDRKLAENKALTEYLQTPEGQRASTAVGLGVASLLPIPGAKTRFAKQMAEIMNPIMSSSARVGTDVVNRFLSPLGQYGRGAPTNRGPRGPINIEQPTQLPLPLRGGRNTGGVSETDQAMIKMQQAQMNPNKGIMNTSSGKSYMEGVASQRLLEQQTNRRNFLRQSVGRDQSLIKANEAPSANYLKDLEELQRLEQLLK